MIKNLPYCFCGKQLSAKRYIFCSEHRATNIKGKSKYKDNLPCCKTCDVKLASPQSLHCKKHVPVSDAKRNKLREINIKNGNKPPVKFGKENHLFGRDCKGEKNPRWIADRSKLQRYSDNDLNRRSYAYAFWRKEVRNRDNHCCKINDKNCYGRLEVHHILGYKNHPELQLEVNNGITLCKFHHPRKREDEKRLIPLFKELINI